MPGDSGRIPGDSVSSAGKHNCADSASQNVEVQPEGPVPDVVRVERLLQGEVAVGPIGNLPEPGQTGFDTLAQSPETRIKLVQMILGKWPWPHQAHLTFKDGPELRQLIQTGLAQKTADAGQDAGIVFEFEMALPFGVDFRRFRK